MQNKTFSQWSEPLHLQSFKYLQCHRMHMALTGPRRDSHARSHPLLGSRAAGLHIHPVQSCGSFFLKTLR